MSAREVLREALCLSFYGTEWANTSAFRRNICDAMARDGFAALDAAGKVVVDKEPTPAMVHAAPGRPNQATEESMYHGIWRAMLAAAVEAADA